MCVQATRIFISNLNAKMAQRFLALVLLPRIRDDIHENKCLHFALFQAMRKAAYKPGAFYKVRIFPPGWTMDPHVRIPVLVSASLVEPLGSLMDRPPSNA